MRFHCVVYSLDVETRNAYKILIWISFKNGPLKGREGDGRIKFKWILETLGVRINSEWN
jgi:hypothetical protein